MQKLPGSTGAPPSPIVGLATCVLPDQGSVLLIVLTAEGALYIYTATSPRSKAHAASPWLLESPAVSNLGICWGCTAPGSEASTQLPSGKAFMVRSCASSFEGFHLNKSVLVEQLTVIPCALSLAGWLAGQQIPMHACWIC